MKLLHTADWHLGDRLGRIDRTADLRAAVERVAAYCHQHAVDVLLVAGDLFSELARPDALRDAIRHWQEVFRDFLAGGGTILTLTGNHDNENFCQTLVAAMALATPTVGRPGDTVPPGRLYLATEPTFLRLEDRTGGYPVQFVLMPYPTPSRYLRGPAPPRYGSPEERNRLLVTAWADALAEIRRHPRYDPQAPAVLGAHVQLYGTAAGTSLFRLSPDDDPVVPGADLPEQFDYVALGHVHKPQCLAAPHVRYSGSIERMDLGESGDQKGVVLVEIGPRGLTDAPQVLPLPATPVYEVHVLDPATDLPRLQAEFPNADGDLVNLHIRYTAGKDHLEDILQKLEKIFPRWYARDWREVGSGGIGPAAEPAPQRGFADTVRDYLNRQLADRDHAERQAILALAEELLQEFGT